MNFAELKTSIETLIGVTFRFKPADQNETFYTGNRWIAYSAHGDIILRDENSARFKGCGDYTDNIVFSEVGSLHGVYRWIVESIKVHHERKDKRIAAMREYMPHLQSLGKMPVEFVDCFETINPYISAQHNGIEMFRVVPRFRTAFVQFTEDSTFDGIGEDDNNGFDCPIHKIEDRINLLPQGLHVFRFTRENEILFGLRAYLTPGCEMNVRELEIERSFNEWVDTAHPFYKRLLRTETVKVVEYTVP